MMADSIKNIEMDNLKTQVQLLTKLLMNSDDKLKHYVEDRAVEGVSHVGGS